MVDHEIRTSEQGWLYRVVEKVKAREEFGLIDDAELGIDPSKQTVGEMAKRGKVPRTEMMRIGAGLVLLTGSVGSLVQLGKLKHPAAQVVAAVAYAGALLFGMSAAYCLATGRNAPTIAAVAEPGRYEFKFG